MFPLAIRCYQREAAIAFALSLIFVYFHGESKCRAQCMIQSFRFDLLITMGLLSTCCHGLASPFKIVANALSTAPLHQGNAMTITPGCSVKSVTRFDTNDHLFSGLVAGLFTILNIRFRRAQSKYSTTWEKDVAGHSTSQ